MVERSDTTGFAKSKKTLCIPVGMPARPSAGIPTGMQKGFGTIAGPVVSLPLNHRLHAAKPTGFVFRGRMNTAISP